MSHKIIFLFAAALMTFLWIGRAFSYSGTGQPWEEYQQNTCAMIPSYKNLCGEKLPLTCLNAGGSADSDTIQAYWRACSMGGNECAARHGQINSEVIDSYFIMCGLSDPESCLRRGGDADTIRTYQAHQDLCTLNVKECQDRFQCK